MVAQAEFLTDSAVPVLHAILDQSQDCIKLLARDGTLEYMNENGRLAMAVGDFGMIAGASWATLWPEESRDLVVAAVDAARHGSKSRFEAYCPTMAGEPRWWDVSVSPIREGRKISHILVTSRDISIQKAERQSEHARRERAEERADFRDLVSREMRHRLKNLLAVVGAIARLTGKQREKTADFLDLFMERVANLADAQYLLAENEDHRADLPALVTRLLGNGHRDARISLGPLPAVSLGDREAQVLALILGELVTNSIKYGGLDCPDGWVRLTVEQRPAEMHFTWVEHCGRPIQPPAVLGSGSQLMARVSAGQPTPVETRWTDEGLEVRFGLLI